MKKNGKIPWSEWGEIQLESSVILLFNLLQILKRFRLSPLSFDQGQMKFPDLKGINVEKTIAAAKNFLSYLQEAAKTSGDAYWAARLILNDDVLQRTFKKHPTVPEVLDSFRRSLAYLEKWIYGEQTDIGNTFFLERFALIACDSGINFSKKKKGREYDRES